MHLPSLRIPKSVISPKTLLFFFLLILGFIGFWPSPVDRPAAGLLARILSFLHHNGFPAWFDYAAVEASANFLLYLPLGLLLALSYQGRYRWAASAVLGSLTSVCVELGQLAFLAERYPSVLDVIMNSFGAAAGAALVGARQAVRHSDILHVDIIGLREK